MDSGKIFNFVRNNLYQLNEPQVYMKDINQDFYGADDWKEDAVHFCLNMPVEASASIANQGMAILYDCINRRMIEDQDHFQMSRGYFPEPKLLKAMKKEGIPHFDKETFHQMRDFDIVGFSSFYAMQYLSLPQLIELSNIPLETKDRGNSLTDHPIVIMGGIQAYSASPLFPCLDLICVGEGEEQLPALLRLFRKAKSEGYTRKQFLIEAAKNIQGILVPQFYKEEYYPSNHETKPNQISFVGLTEEGKELGIPPVVLKACVDFANTPICTKPFVTCAEGAEMSIGSCFVANGCGNFCSFCQGSALAAPYRERREEDIKQAFWDIKRNTGCDEAVPYSFNISDLSCVNEISRFILEELHCSLSFSSERLDQMNEDFIKCMRLSGSRSATVAIESASPRGRKILNKNLSEKQILDAFEIMFKAKLSSIKIYNISSFAFCQKEDIDYYPILMKKLDDLRQKYNPKTKLRLSFTPLG